jgi:hypothetical protein
LVDGTAGRGFVRDQISGMARVVFARQAAKGFVQVVRPARLLRMKEPTGEFLLPGSFEHRQVAAGNQAREKASEPADDDAR